MESTVKTTCSTLRILDRNKRTMEASEAYVDKPERSSDTHMEAAKTFWSRSAIRSAQKICAPKMALGTVFALYQLPGFAYTDLSTLTL